MVEQIVEIMKQVFESDEVNENTSQENCSEWDSMKNLALAFELEQKFNVSLEPDDMAKMKSVKEIVSIIKTKTE